MRFMFESHRGVAERRDLPLSNPPRLLPQVTRRCSRRRSPARRSTIIHVMRARERPLEILVEHGVVRAHDNEQLCIRK